MIFCQLVPAIRPQKVRTKVLRQKAAGRRGVTIPDKQVPGVYHRPIGDIVVTALSDSYVDASYTVMRIAPEDAEAILAFPAILRDTRPF
jgi:hypothetical protein